MCRANYGKQVVYIDAYLPEWHHVMYDFLVGQVVINRLSDWDRL